jgi:hypothetical protein
VDTHADFSLFELQYADIFFFFTAETLCYRDVLFRRRFVTGDVPLRRRFVTERFCMETFVEETFCAETFYMCAILSALAIKTLSDDIMLYWYELMIHSFFSFLKTLQTDKSVQIVALKN